MKSSLESSLADLRPDVLWIADLIEMPFAIDVRGVLNIQREPTLSHYNACCVVRFILERTGGTYEVGILFPASLDHKQHCPHQEEKPGTSFHVFFIEWQRALCNV